MKLNYVCALFFASGIALAANIVRRDGTTILSDLTKIKTQNAKVYQDVQNYNRTTSSALQIYNDANDLDTTIQDSGNDAKNSAAFSQADSVNIANSVVTLQPAIFQTLQALVDKKQGFTAAALGFDAIPLVYGSLTNLRTDTAYFGNNVTAKLITQLKNASPLLTSNIDFHFARAQQAFSTG